MKGILQRFSQFLQHASKEEEEVKDFGLGSFITGAEVAVAVKKLSNGSATRLVEICPKFLKAPDVVGLSWLTRPATLRGHYGLCL